MGCRGWQCPFILETEVGSLEVGTGWRWGFSGVGRGSSAGPFTLSLPLLSVLTGLVPESGDTDCERVPRGQDENPAEETGAGKEEEEGPGLWEPRVGPGRE